MNKAQRILNEYYDLDLRKDVDFKGYSKSKEKTLSEIFKQWSVLMYGTENSFEDDVKEMEKLATKFRKEYPEFYSEMLSKKLTGNMSTKAIKLAVSLGLIDNGQFNRLAISLLDFIHDTM